MDPTLIELDLIGGLTEAEMANLAFLDAWTRHEAADLAILNEASASGENSLLSKAVVMAPELPAGRELRPSIFCRDETIGGEEVMVAGIRFTSRDRPHEKAAYVILTLFMDEGFASTNEDIISEDEATMIGVLAMGKFRWAELRHIPLTGDGADIVLRAPALPAPSPRR